MTGGPSQGLRPRRRSGLAPVLGLLIAIGAACGSDDGTDGRTIRVFAAASLTDALAEVADGFEAARPGLDVELNLAGSSTLRAQILDGAPADVFASASPDVMDQVVEAGATAGPATTFATNRLAIAVPSGNPAGIVDVGDFARTDLLLGLCAPGVPCGDLADAVLAAGGIQPSVDTREPDVRALLTKVAAGELDGGIVYATDVLASNDVDGIAVPGELGATATYPVAVLADGPNRDGGAAFVEFLLSDDGRRILVDHGFGVP